MTNTVNKYVQSACLCFFMCISLDNQSAIWLDEKFNLRERERDLWKWKHNRTMEIFKKMQTCSLENSISSSSQMSEAAGYLIVKWFSIEGRSL